MNQFDWIEKSHANYYFIKENGKIIGKVTNLPLSNIFIALVYTGQYTFTVDDERHLGQYIDMNYAKDAVQYYWDTQSRTLLENS